jgi:hypothetical protein
MSKFKNIGTAMAGVIPDYSGVFRNQAVTFANLSAQQREQSQKIQKYFAQIEAETRNFSNKVESKANQIAQATDDVGLDAKLRNHAAIINDPIQKASRLDESDVTLAISRLDNLDAFDNSIRKLKRTLVDFKTTASVNNMSSTTLKVLEKVLDNDFEYDVNKIDTERNIILSVSKEIDVNQEFVKQLGLEDDAYNILTDKITIPFSKLENLYVARDSQGIRNTQIIINRYTNPDNKSFNSISFNQDMNAVMDNRDHIGAKIMVEEMSGGPGGSIKDNLQKNIASFANILVNSGADIDNDGQPDTAEQITEYGAVELINILTQPGHNLYDEKTTNSFVKSVLEGQTKKTFEANVAAKKANQPNFEINRDLFAKTSTGRFLKNLSGIHRSLYTQDPDQAESAASKIGLTVVPVDGKPNTYQLYKFKLEDDGEGGLQKTPSVSVSNEFNIKKPSEFVSQLELILSRSKGQDFSPKDFNTYMMYIDDIDRAEQLLYPDVEVKKQTGGKQTGSFKGNTKFADPMVDKFYSDFENYRKSFQSVDR